MEHERNEFLYEVEDEITKRIRLQNFYLILRLFLMVTITICGFLTATASQFSSGSWLASPGTLLGFGIVSAVCAVLNQSLNPSAKNLFHRNIREALEFIQGEVRYSELPLAEAHKLKSVAVNEPEIVLGRMKKLFEYL
jgi:hypothetical protein